MNECKCLGPGLFFYMHGILMPERTLGLEEKGKLYLRKENRHDEAGTSPGKGWGADMDLGRQKTHQNRD